VSHIVARKIFDSARKTAMLTCKITLPDSPHPTIISKNPRFWACISLDKMNSVFSFNSLIQFLSFLAASFCRKNLALARKIMALPESGAAAPRAPCYTAYLTTERHPLQEEINTNSLVVCSSEVILGKT